MTLRGGTTAGASLSPEPGRAVCGAVPPPRCALPVLAEVGNAVVGAVASARKCLGAKHPQGPRGRPCTQAAQQAARKQKRLAQTRADFFTHRYLCVKPPLSQRARKTWWRLSRGLPPWRKLRELMAQVSTSCDRRWRTQTALDKRAKRRRRRHRCQPRGETRKKLCAPTLAKALTFLDATWLPSTSHAGERGHRRYRQMPQQVYRVCPPAHIRARLGLDLWREAQGEGRRHTLQTLQEARAG